jgi:YHS domain-containing protein
VIIRILLFAAVIYLLFKLINTVKQLKSDKNENSQSKSSSGKGEDLVEDPVCHTHIPVSQAYKREIAGKDYCFCSKECSDKFILEKNN